MGKKKNRQNSNMAVNVDCSESWDATNNVTADPDESCKHIVKVLKKWKNSENFKNARENLHCGYCKASSQADSKKSLQLCLSCGASSCGIDGENHAKHHYDTPRSDCHCLTIDLESLSLWCYECNLEPVIPQKCRARIDEIKEKIKNVSEKHQPPRKSSNSTSENKVLNKNQFMATNKEDKKTQPVIPNKVKGLSNLGNTCFFNSVLQCLAQTPGLAECLREMRKGGEEISIVPKDSEPITGTLEKGGPVSGALLDLISEMSSSESRSADSFGKSVLVPRDLMTELGKKCPQLMDGDQHDSHELLRQLLDVVFNEDLRRYRRIILKKFGLEKTNPEAVPEEKRKWLKGLDNLVSEQFVMKPYEVFRGTLVSELQCEECHNISSREENFLDLSLPVNVEKPQPPAFARRKYLNQTNSVNGKLPCTVQSNVAVDDNKAEEAKSPKRGNRRGVKRNREAYQVIRDHGEGSITEEEKKENDADVEDNVEIGVDDQKEVFESGYSSEKPASSRTSPTTESRQNDGDADADSACASPSASLSVQSPSECSHKVSAAVSAALANLAADASEQVTSPPNLPDPLTSNLPVASALPYTESENSSDSAGSLRANPGFSSPDLSTESLQDIGLLSQERSGGSEHDDSQSNDISSTSKDHDVAVTMMTHNYFCPPTTYSSSTFCQSEDSSGSAINPLPQQAGYTDFVSALKAIEEADDDEHSLGKPIETDRPCFNNLALTETIVKNDSGDPNSGLTITPIEEASCAATEAYGNIDLETTLPCLDYISPNCRLKEFTLENLSGECKDKLTLPCLPSKVRDNLNLRLLKEEQREDGCESKGVCLKNGSHDGYESVSNDEADSRPCSRLDAGSSKARSSPVDGQLVEKFLEDMVLTEKLNSVTNDRRCVSRTSLHLNTSSDLVESLAPPSSPPSNSGHLGFVLVGGITATTNSSDTSTRVESASTRPTSDTVRPSLNICKDDDDECAEVSPEVYKKNHMTLAPRYQCEEGECSVLSCLNHFTAIEMMAGNNKAGCDMCTKRQNKGKEKDAKTVYTNSTKRLLISKPPPILILHLKRFQVQMRSFRKLSCHVTFPLVLDIAPFCSKSCENLLEKGQTQLLYSLYGVVEHSGTLHGGHYVAYVKVREGEQKPNQPREGSWYFISDSRVSPVKEEAVLRTQAYLLFYERIM
ncbi:hypothetical protein LSTR_LSTR008381 [Laodelphax striatellus]|uniref:ubiquitinyl hydrolase 1 n=1 Tax=Laodelphax striatellus TaxID=195883 RepID=A0A482XSJ3_LAOST|nr:hypothetical protein LSTR_LSTR008381 [Laodelphax striatellus]